MLELLFSVCSVVNVWNSLPDTVGFTSLTAFNRSIRTFNVSEFLKGNDVIKSVREPVSAANVALLSCMSCMYVLLCKLSFWYCANNE